MLYMYNYKIMESNWFQRYFSGPTHFGRTARCELSNPHQHSISQLILEIILPDLPVGIHYKSNIIHELI